MLGSTLHVLGPVALRSAATGEAVHLGRKAHALLTFVASHGASGTSRSSLLALLWPDHGDEDARSSLRQCLHQIRRALGDATELFETEGERVALRENECDVDLWRFERLAAKADHSSLLAAIQLYRGEFAEGLHAGADFDRWLTAERERLRGLTYELALGLSENATTVAERNAAMHLARRLLVDDPLHEGCYRVLMRLYAGAGLRAKALQLWDDCRRALRIELGAEPSAETAELYESVRAASANAAHDGGVAPPGLPEAVAAYSMATSHDRAGDDRLIIDHLLRGWQLFTEFTAQGNPRARAEIEAALQHAPGHAEAHAMLGWTHFMDFVSGWSERPALSFDCAVQAATRATACNKGHPAPHALRGKLLLWQMAHDEALAELQRAVAAAPASAYTHFHLAEATMWAGHYDEALRHVRRALRLDPNDHGIFLAIEGMALFSMGDLPAARKALASAIVRNPTYPWPHATLAALLAEAGNLAGARESAATAKRLNRRLSLDFAAGVLPIRSGVLRRRLCEGWRAAGMPEHEAAWSCLAAHPVG